jgi:hypothetical protein
MGQPALQLTPEETAPETNTALTAALGAFPDKRGELHLRMAPKRRDSKFDLVLRRPPSNRLLIQHIARVRSLRTAEARELANLEFYGRPVQRKSDGCPEGEPETFGRCTPVAVYQTWFGYCEVEAARLNAAGIEALVVSDGIGKKGNCALYSKVVAGNCAPEKGA